METRELYSESYLFRTQRERERLQGHRKQPKHQRIEEEDHSTLCLTQQFKQVLGGLISESQEIVRSIDELKKREDILVDRLQKIIQNNKRHKDILDSMTCDNQRKLDRLQ